MKKVLLIIATVLVILFLVVMLGPDQSFDSINPDIETLDIPLEEIEEYVAAAERKVQGIKEDNHSRIIWADSVRKTDYAIVYLHGFSASPMESYPLHMDLAKRYGCNIYLPRLSQHGLSDEEAFLQLTPVSLMASAKEAVAIGNLLGEKVILMSCSTGGTLSIYLAAHNPELIEAQILYSPNIQIYDPTVKIVNDPWGAVILKQIVGDYRSFPDETEAVQQYWNTRYRSEGIIALQELLEQAMTTEVFEQVNQPYFLGYYYKNEEEQDKTVSVEAMQAYHKVTGTPEDQKVSVAFPDVASHVIASEFQSKDIESVREASQTFMENILGLQAAL